jgi:ketosteroid isomerase-like protein
MRTTIQQLLTLTAAMLLAGCANFGVREPLWETAPVAPPPSSATPLPAISADQAYAEARELHLALRFGDALAVYRAGLQADPGHVNLRNGLASLYAEQGDLTQAIALWRDLTAQALPGTAETAFLFTNLGYGYLLNREYASALEVLETSSLLDPLSPRTWQHMGSALQKMGEEVRAQAMFQRAGALQAREGSAVANAGGASASAAPQWASTDVRATGEGTVELRRVGATGVRPEANSFVDHEEVLKTVETWALAWSARDVKTYLSMYGSNFEPPKGQLREAWSAERRARIENKSRISVKVESPQVKLNGNSATVKFRQLYAAGRLNADNMKTLVLEKHGDTWKIKREITNS